MRWPSLRRRLVVWYHPSFRLPFSGNALGGGIDPRRADHVLTWLLDERIVHDRDVHEAPEAHYSDLRRVHEDSWLAALDDNSTVAGLLGMSGVVPVASMVELWRRGVGGTLAAARWVADESGVAASLMGGFHHSGPALGAGFCGLNDIAVAIAVRRSEGLEGTILVLDLDAHPPDGLAAFALPDVEIRSVSGDSEWTADGVFDVRVPLGSGDAPYLHAVDKALDTDTRPVLAFYLAGSDPAVGDALGGLSVTAEGLRERDRRVFRRLNGVPTVVVPGGGYSPRSWALLAGTLAEATRSRKSVPSSYDPIARKIGRVARTLAPFEEEITITEADLGSLLGGPRHDRRFLEHYTRHGLEHALDQYGLFDTLRRMGFSAIELEVQAEAMPHRLRVFGEFAGERHKLMELVLSFRAVESWQTLFIEWLELVDPRASVGRPRPDLPGQASRGLGMARDVASILDVATARLKLDGLSFVPSHFHVAWMARNQAQFIDPVARGKFRALRKYLRDVSLAEASAAVAEGLPTEDGDLIRWTPSLMVRAHSPELLEWIRSTERQAANCERDTLFQLLPVEVPFPQLR